MSNTSMTQSNPPTTEPHAAATTDTGPNQVQTENHRPKRWQIHLPAPEDFLSSSGEHPLLLQVLYNRGVRTADEIRTFLSARYAVNENPFKLKDMLPAVERLVSAIQHGEIICVYGDFDADGVSSTALLVSALQAAGGKVGPYIPDRVDEGYGLNREAIGRVAQKARVMVTVDCGIRSIDEVAYARQIDLDVIVTDHHSVGTDLPPALAVINPRRIDCQSNFKSLAGVGVAYRLAQGVLRTVAQQPWGVINEEQAAEIELTLLDFVAIGTVADVMPLLGQNRTLVQRGLRQLNKTERPGLRELMAVSDLRPGGVDAMAIGFRLGPRINAAGRLGNAHLAYQLLRTNDKTQGYSLACELEALNKKRRTLTDVAQTEAQKQLADKEQSGQAQGSAIKIVQSPNIQSGIVGLVAGRLTEHYYRPAVVIELGESESRGSARSIPEFDISKGLDDVSELLIRHGGHSRAAGFTVATERLSDFTAALEEVAHSHLQQYDTLQPTLMIDAEIPLDQANWALQNQFTRLEPTGSENSAPLLLCRNCRVRQVRTVGQGKHLKLILDADQGSPVLDAIAFRMGEWQSILSEHDRVDVVFHLESNEWQGRKRLQMNIQDMRKVY
ncbi:MAG: single-stranded-DNA-specific exonuclease RecJ [Chloroflexota bacterium]